MRPTDRRSRGRTTMTSSNEWVASLECHDVRQRQQESRPSSVNYVPDQLPVCCRRRAAWTLFPESRFRVVQICLESNCTSIIDRRQSLTCPFVRLSFRSSVPHTSHASVVVDMLFAFGRPAIARASRGRSTAANASRASAHLAAVAHQYYR